MLGDKNKFWAIGLMSGTSMDGVDAAEIKSDGTRVLELGKFVFVPYEKSFKEKLRELINLKDSADKNFIAEVEVELTEYHALAVKNLLKESAKNSGDFDLIGFHGHTIDHKPHQKYTWQIGDSNLLAGLTGISVVSDFRKNDVMLGGQGAPLVPLYHKALVDFPFYPAAIINIGGVANITFIDNEDIIAFDTGPGNALIDDYVSKNFQQDFDDGGEIAKSGEINFDLLESLMDNIYFLRKPPKSLDRNDFKLSLESYLSDEKYKDLDSKNVVTTLTHFTVRSIALAFDQLPVKPQTVFVCGGGVKNKYIIEKLEKELDLKVFDISVIDMRLNADAIEAQAFGYLAIRSKMGLPITFSKTTGVKKSSVTGGVFYPA